MPPPQRRGAPGRTGSVHRFLFQRNRSAKYEVYQQGQVNLRNKVTPAPRLQYGGMNPPRRLTETTAEGVQHTPDRKHIVSISTDVATQFSANVERFDKIVLFRSTSELAGAEFSVYANEVPFVCEAPPPEPTYNYEKLTIKDLPDLTIEYAVSLVEPVDSGPALRNAPVPVPYEVEEPSSSEKIRTALSVFDVTGTLGEIEGVYQQAKLMRIYRDYLWQLEQHYKRELPIGAELVGTAAMSVYPDGSVVFWLRAPGVPIEDVITVVPGETAPSLAVIESRANARKRPQLVLQTLKWGGRITAIDKCFPGGNFDLLMPMTSLQGVDIPHQMTHDLLLAGTAPYETKAIEQRIWSEYVQESMQIESGRGVYSSLALMSQCPGFRIRGNRPALLRYHEFITELYKRHPDYFVPHGDTK